ncbi:MAG TPA: XdhC family protein [Solirubrobacteraceae bacterium]|nr:XdhC family protein [Solirubrobacteraceae bacterium]
MRPVLDTVHDWALAGEPVAVATVVETKRSAPQPIGTKMAVNGSGEIVGAVSGGCVEGAVVEVGEQVLAGAAPELLRYGIANEEAWDVGLPCGGEIAVFVEAYRPDGALARFGQLARAGERVARVTVVGGDAGAELLVVDGEAPAGTLGDARLDAEAAMLAGEALWSEDRALHVIGDVTVFVDVAAPPPRLLIVGAVDFAAHLAAAAGLLGWRAYVIDPRARFATPERFPGAERVLAVWPQEAFAELAPIDAATAIAVLTHDPKLDDAALLAALASDAGYIGAMGSRSAQADRRERLLGAGVSEEQLRRIAAPIGLDLGARTAAETAVSIVGEIIALRSGRAGGRLLDAEGPVHVTIPA